MYLYIDTTQYVTVAIFDKKTFKFKEYVSLHEKKSSKIIHSTINDLLTKQGVDPLKLEGIIICAGPGSYTGMRVGEGIAQIFEWQEIEKFSFYHFDVPRYAGISSGVWFANAFKGEVYIHTWDGKDFSDKLILNCDFNKYQQRNKLMYTHFLEEEEADSSEIVLTSKMIRDMPEVILKKIIEDREQKPLYYFRELEKEFKRNNSSRSK